MIRSVVYVVIDLAFAVLGFLAGRLAIALLPVLVWAVWGVGLASDWWGNGGEQILLGSVVLIVLGVGAACLGVLANRLLLRPRS